ncbi:MAG: L,D-transpeptidase [bacterium]|nr:L,D-transpeptidase [bacterium]
MAEPPAPDPPPDPPDPPSPPSAQPLPPPETPSWSPVTVLVSKDTVNGIIPVYDAPGGDRLSFRDGEVWSYTFRGNRLVVRVLRGTQGDEWAQVELPVRPNGSRGWIRTDNFNWSTVNHHVLIDLSDRLVALFDGDDLVTYTRAIVGKSTTPTPALRGFVVEKLPNHSQQNASAVLGDWILMLSFFSQALDSFSGGLPRIALHGTHIPDRIGEALSNGCIRIPNNIIEVIARTAPLGTVVNISA